MRLPRLVAAALLAVAVPGSAMAADFFDARCPTPVVIHKAPKKVAPRVVTVPKHASVRVYRCDGWCEVTYGPYRGFVEGRDLVEGERRARKITATPKYGRKLNGPYVPVYVAPQTAWLSSQTVNCCGRPNGRVWYFDGRYVDRPDVFRFLQR